MVAYDRLRRDRDRSQSPPEETVSLSVRPLGWTASLKCRLDAAAAKTDVSLLRL